MDAAITTTPLDQKRFIFPEGYTRRGSRKNAVSRPGLHPNPSLPVGSRNRAAARTLPLLRNAEREATFVPQYDKSVR